MKNEKLLQLTLYVVVIIAALVFSYFYVRWQFDLCYPEVSPSFWYCLQHAAG